MQEALRGKNEFSNSCVLSVSACTFSNDSLDEHGSSSQRDSSTIVSEFSSTKTLMNIDDSLAGGSVREFFLNNHDEQDKNELSQPTNKIFHVDYCLDIKDSWLQSTTIPRAESTSSKKKQFSKSASHLHSTKSQFNQETINSESKVKNAERKKIDANQRKTESQRVPLKDRDWSKKSSKNNSPERRNIKRKSSPKPKSPRRNFDDRSKSSSPSPTRIKRPRIADIAIDKAKQSIRKSSHIESCSQDQMKNLLEIKKDTKENQKQKKKIVLDFGEFPPPKSERRVQSSSSNASSSDEDFNDYQHHHSHLMQHQSNNNFYLSPIEENSETSTSGSGSQDKFSHKQLKSKKVAFADSSSNNLKEFSFHLDFDASRKYHTYPKSRIPIPRRSMNNREFRNLIDPKLYPLEPREIDLEAFQQLHTADSQEELQEFLLLESQCSGNLGLATNFSNSEISDHHSDDERGTMSGIFFLLLLTN